MSFGYHVEHDATSSRVSETLGQQLKQDCIKIKIDRKCETIKTKHCTHVKPGMSYIALISMAIQSTPNQKMLLSEIYQWISERYPYYQLKDKSWRNSIRHNLSLNECFVKSGRSESGKGNYWSIHPANMEDFSNGDFRRRQARRRVRKCDDDLKNLCCIPLTNQATQNVSVGNGNGYVPMMSTLVPSSYVAATFGGEDSLTPNYWLTNSFCGV